MAAHSGAMEPRRPSLAYLLTPCIAVLCAAGPILGLRVGTVPWWFSNLPFWIGMAGAPGYVYVWSDRWRGRHLPWPVIYGLHASMGAALVASVWSTVLLLFTVLFWVFPAISAWLTVQLWTAFVRRDGLDRAEDHEDSLGRADRRSKQ
jgi:hypothetical protein